MEGHDVRIGFCGLFSGACSHFVLNVENNPQLYEDRKQPNEPIEEFICGGCNAEDNLVHPECRSCPGRSCASDRNYISCAECGEVPCVELVDFNNDGRPHHADAISNLEGLKIKGFEAWLIENERRWRCQCGQRFLWYDQECSSCGELVGGYRR